MSSGIEGGAPVPEAAARVGATDGLGADDVQGDELHRLRTESRHRLNRTAEEVGLRRIDVVAWRDLDDAEAGGSELHAHEILTRWADAGIDVRLWTSRVDGAARAIRRNGYAVNRRAGRYAVFPRTAVAGFRHKIGMGDGLVEIWNGMPFFSPIWSRCPRLVFLHHVHAEMWDMALSPTLAKVGYTVEHRLAPPFYRRSQIVTLSDSARDDLVERLHLSRDRVTVVPPGIDPRFSPGGTLDPDPFVVAVGRLVPVKRFAWFVEAMLALKVRQPRLRAMIVGEGYERPELEARIADAGAGEWFSLPGRVNDAELVQLYRRAWLVGSTSVREGWGMTITEAAACGTPAVATRIAGHEDAVIEGESGLLATSVPELVEASESILANPMLRRRLSQGALRRTESMTWERTAEVALQTLAAQVTRRR
ncbi:MAG: glycosyltransferase family 4 protein [Acidimicrobiales bacterium]